MMNILDSELGSANTILLAIDGSTPRFSSGLQDMLTQMSSIFGQIWWDFMMIGVTKWKYSQAAIDERQANCDFYGDPSEHCKNEAWFIRALTEQLEEKFGQNIPFTFAFMDSFSQSGPNQMDDVQQEYWSRETAKLWKEATTKNETFDFLTIDDILEENFICKQENDRLHDIIDEELSSINKTLGDHEDDMQQMEQIIEKNRHDIEMILGMNELSDAKYAINRKCIISNSEYLLF